MGRWACFGSRVEVQDSGSIDQLLSWGEGVGCTLSRGVIS